MSGKRMLPLEERWQTLLVWMQSSQVSTQGAARVEQLKDADRQRTHHRADK